jgi:hypothetical protein
MINKFIKTENLLKKLFIINVFFILIFISSNIFSYDLIVQGLEEDNSIVTCNINENSKDCILNSLTNNIIVSDNIYIEISPDLEDKFITKELNLIINQDINFIVQVQELSFGNTTNFFKSLIIKDEVIVKFKKSNTNLSGFRVLSNISDLNVLNDSALIFESKINDLDLEDYFDDENISIEIISPYLDFKNTNIYIDSDSNLNFDFKLIYHINSKECDCSYDSNNCYSIKYEFNENNNLDISKKFYNCEYDSDNSEWITTYDYTRKLTLNLDHILNTNIFSNINNNGTLKIINKGAKIKLDQDINYLNVAPINILNYSGDDFISVLDNDKENIGFLKTCNDYSNINFQNNYLFNLCYFFIVTPAQLNLNNLNNLEYQQFIDDCGNNFTIPEEQYITNFLYINEDKIINPYLLGKIQGNNSENLNNNLNDFILKDITDSNISNLNELVSNSIFILKGTDINVKLLNFYKFYFKLNYLESDINLNIPFALYNN